MTAARIPRAGLVGAGPIILAALILAAPGCAGKKDPVHAVSAESSPVALTEEESGAPRFMPVPISDLPVYDEAALAEESLEGPYHVAAGDVLEVSVYGDPDLTHQVPVRPDGMISFTFVGDVAAAGRTIEEIRAELKNRLSVFLRTPEVTVIAREFSQPKVYVGGEVSVPGVYYLTPRENTLMDVVYRAGLTPERADMSQAVLARNGRLVPVDFAELLRGDLTDNVVLRDQDLVHVPEATERFIYVLGEVQSPRAMETLIPRSITDVLANAGGPRRPEAKMKDIAVLRGGLKEPRIAVVNFRRLLQGDLSQNISIHPGDIVYVPPTGLTKYTRVVEQILRTFNLFFQARIFQTGFN
jgi:polysaccharide export outer membrane protein